MEFRPFNKIPRFYRDIVITEKLDGTNASVIIADATELTEDAAPAFVLARCPTAPLVMLAGSRTRFITPQEDNYGFAAWVAANASTLWALGPGTHFGEWWGSGIQRRYGLQEKRFSLFNASRWGVCRDQGKFPDDLLPSCCSVVPVLYQGPFTAEAPGHALLRLRAEGSVAAPGFQDPEGIVIFHAASGHAYKVTLDGDGVPKSQGRKVNDGGQ